MKTQKLLFSLLNLLLLSTGLMATGNEVEKSTSVFSIENQLAKSMTCPEYIHYQGLPVEIEVAFHIENDFTITVETISCNNEWLKQHVQKELTKLKLLVDRESVGKTFTVKLIYQ